VRLVPREQGYVGTRPKQPPSTRRQARRAIASLSPLVPSYSPSCAVVPSFLAVASLDAIRLFQRWRKTDPACLPLSFCENRTGTLLLFVSIAGVPINDHPLPRGDPSAIPSISSAWQPTIARHCHHTTSAPRSVYIATLVSTNAFPSLRDEGVSLSSRRVQAYYFPHEPSIPRGRLNQLITVQLK